MLGAVTVVELGPLPIAYICWSYELSSIITLSPTIGFPPQLLERSKPSTRQSSSPVIASKQMNGAPRGFGSTGECS
jgi:hypothetical protein